MTAEGPWMLCCCIDCEMYFSSLLCTTVPHVEVSSKLNVDNKQMSRPES
jgi:hypothetical protein